MSCALSLGAETTSEGGQVIGRIVDKVSNQSVEFVTVELHKKSGEKTAYTAVTDANGSFTLTGVPPGEYFLVYSSLGLGDEKTPPFKVEVSQPQKDLGTLTITESSIKLAKMEVQARKEEFYNSVDRKVYSVGKDIQSSTGSISSFLQNIPSVQVDIEGNVSLRGNENVLILIDGKPSSLMGANRAAVLEQMPADSIERVEVITNPSAKYKPDGTAGIINITRKKKGSAASSTTVRISVGNESRGNASVTSSLTKGKVSVYGSFSLRQDDRLRTNSDVSRRVDTTGGVTTITTSNQFTREKARPLSRIGQAGGEYRISAADTLGAGFNYNYRTFFRTSTEYTTLGDGSGTVTKDYTRSRTDPEFEKETEYEANWTHSFDKDGGELKASFKAGLRTEQEDNHYIDYNRLPAAPPVTADNFLNRNRERTKELSLENSHPFRHDGKLESGYSLETDKLDAIFLRSELDVDTGSWIVDPNTSNRFIFEQTIQALYATYAQPVGDFGFLAGLRGEQAKIDTNQLTQVAAGSAKSANRYYRLYPTLHLTYNLTDAQQLQLNYSHRVHRPESDDLNPFPEYQDPLHLRAGNPNLKPEETHSIEGGWQYKKKDITYLSTLYFRETYHAFTQVTEPLASDRNVLLTTFENLSNNRAGGLELSATRGFGRLLSVNASSNLYRSQIDASNLGYSTTKSANAWSAKLSSNVHVTKSDLVQLNLNYTAKRLTPQGYRLPTFVTNVGLRHDLPSKKAAVLLTVSDVFNSLKDRTRLDTPALQEEITRRRSARIIYLGFLYNFGKTAKKPKDDLQFDNSAP
ncbi:MAG: TonB-dependent receptor [Nibricoccus sp.]